MSTALVGLITVVPMKESSAARGSRVDVVVVTFPGELPIHLARSLFIGFFFLPLMKFAAGVVAKFRVKVIAIEFSKLVREEVTVTPIKCNSILM